MQKYERFPDYMSSRKNVSVLLNFGMKIERTVNIVNRRARFEYEILEEYEAGIVLYGTEIKSLRSSKASIAESFCQMKDGELWVVNMMIDEYKMGSFYNHKAKRDRKLLLHKGELSRLEKKVKDVGFTIIPLKLYINDKGRAKLLIGFGRGKKLFDKRESIKKRESDTNLSRIRKNF